MMHDEGDGGSEWESEWKITSVRWRKERGGDRRSYLADGDG